jgi:UPF0755 protein
VKEGRKMLRHILKVIVCIIGFAFILAVVAVSVVSYLNESPETASGEVLFEVNLGESARVIGRRLEDAGLIKSRYFWYILNRLNNKTLKAGTYRLELPAAQTEIHALFVKGQLLLVKVTVPEGVTIGKTARIFAEAGICSEESFLQAAEDGSILDTYRIPGKTMEGYLYPDTYFFQENYPAEKVVGVMADTFFKRLAEIEGASSLTPKEVFDKVILASIVEREYRDSEEAPLMAGVFYNRLAINMALQSCATVEYVITEIQGKPHPEVLYTRDTEINNPYNTYLYRGLPPGPICMPGIVALNAAFYPTSSNYLYFRLINLAAGKHYFSKTFDDHIKAGQLYVKGR